MASGSDVAVAGPSKEVLRDTPEKFGWISIGLHWATAVAVLALLVTGFFVIYVNWAASGLYPGDHHTQRMAPFVTGEAAAALRAWRIQILNVHIAIGILTTPLIIWRIWWRVRSGHPREPSQNRILQWLTAVNWPLLLIFIVIMFATGPLLPLLHGTPLNFFGTPVIPAIFPRGVAELDGAHAAFVLPVHVWVAFAMALLVGLHIAGVLKHWLIDRDGVIQRMLRPGELRDRAKPAARTEAMHGHRALSVVAWTSWITMAVVVAAIVYSFLNLAAGNWVAQPQPQRPGGGGQVQGGGGPPGGQH